MTKEEILDMIIEEVATMPVEELDLSDRDYNCLKRVEIHTVGELVQFSENDLLNIIGLELKSIEKIKDKLDTLGWQLKDDFSYTDKVGITSLEETSERLNAELYTLKKENDRKEQLINSIIEVQEAILKEQERKEQLDAKIAELQSRENTDGIKR